VRSRIHRGRKQLRAYLLRHAPIAYREYDNEL
jgi:DNA-directed RNA polymerase specialized sigma24 family protein